ncbi:MAG TPA: putative Fe-S cluster assembly protein SufT [Microthrixaceae bacterium]|nr:putative Fe-S cluster assembly protein SufT [Microthrixaceae bacterium]HPB45056.1 putative Fe-S cluster assembly protein SufT [Microthrixaceae bacterium]
MSAAWNPIHVSRDTRASTVPAGNPVVLAEGTEVTIIQQLGGSVTVRNQMGALLRIDGADADALGIEIEDIGLRARSDGPFEMSQVLEALGEVYDPEIPVNIVELGLVYRCEEHQRADGGRRIEIDMSMTAPGCGMGDVLRLDAERAVAAVPGVDEVVVEVVWFPPWNMGLMSDAARLQLGLM